MRLKRYLDEGVSKTELSRRFGVSRRTIHHWIETGQLDRDLAAGCTRREPRSRVHKLDPYKGIIDARLAEFPRLSALRLFDEVCAAGYAGGYGRVRDYVRKVRPCEPAEPLVRYETPPGRQGQVDFGTFTLPWGRRHALLVVLGHSRLLWLRFYPRQTMAVLIDGLESAFERFGGVLRELLFDQMRGVCSATIKVRTLILIDALHAVVLSDDRTAGGELILNAEFLRFAAHWGFMPRSCRPYRAQTKGKVERPIRYLRESFFYGREFAGDGDLNDQAAHWVDGTANVRLHGTTGERPVDRFERDERHVLGALEAVDGILAQADSGGATAAEALEELLAAQIALRNNRRLDSAMRSSRLPAVKTLAQFDFAFQPSVKREQIESRTSSASSNAPRTWSCSARRASARRTSPSAWRSPPPSPEDACTTARWPA
ncbi:MAG: DDE-type integrase/transposase/recombinase [Gammaproteobacteria bacterium]|nr:DDE-type integrase/transposase/recombinase [Gammaproteobacteria bacterium]